jgi:hypothetical protein
VTERQVTLAQPTRQQVEVCEGFRALSATVPIAHWCVIGGMLKRLRWLAEALENDERAWHNIDRVDRSDATLRLNQILDSP